MRMSEIEISEYARQLLEAHGDRAVVESARISLRLRGKGRDGGSGNLAAYPSRLEIYARFTCQLSG